MWQHQTVLSVRTRGRGLREITNEVQRVVAASGIQIGVCHLFLRHTSASLVIQENADPTARDDLLRWFDRIAPDDDPLYRHTSEGPDDMPSHLKATLTSTSESIPVVDGRLALGTWQGIYLFEHRRDTLERTLLVHILGE